MGDILEKLKSNRLIASMLELQEIDQKLLEKISINYEKKPSLVQALLEAGVSSEQLLKHASRLSRLPIFDPRSMDLTIDPDGLRKILPRDEMERHYIFPLYKNQGVIYVAIVDPTNLSALEKIRLRERVIVEPILVEARHLAAVMESLGGTDREALQNIFKKKEGEEPTAAEEALAQRAADEESVVINLAGSKDDVPLVQFINGVLADAIDRGASDLHFEPYEHSYRVRFRIDGVLQEMYRPPEEYRTQLAARIKVMSQLDITERRLPQDGRIKVVHNGKVIDFRISILPTLWGEKVVMRILDSSAASLNIDILGFEDDQKAAILEAIEKPQGMILVTGPTGSGKTVTLYTCMGILNQPTTNLSTAEDPVEINLEGINQVPVNPAIGLTFAEALRSFLRQDPDVIMVGEIRDLETADIAIKAAQTGHLVLSTLHTNSAPETLTRLINMGVETFNIASTVHLIIAQRLARRLCNHCKEEVTYDTEHLVRLGFTRMQASARIYGPVGCDQCTRGYKGRVGIYEVMPISDTTERMILDNASGPELADQAEREGINSIRKSGILKVVEGITSIEELMRVTAD